MKGKGKIDGQGWKWWIYALTCALPHEKHNDTRGSMIYWNQSHDIIIEDLTFVNSPRFHIFLNDIHNIIIRNFIIFVDVAKQASIIHSYIDTSTISTSSSSSTSTSLYHLPTFPLNTDGIDVRGSNAVIYNGVITNYDDAIVSIPFS